LAAPFSLELAGPLRDNAERTVVLFASPEAPPLKLFQKKVFPHTFPAAVFAAPEAVDI
jgi:hypothetical protein